MLKRRTGEVLNISSKLGLWSHGEHNAYLTKLIVPTRTCALESLESPNDRGWFLKFEIELNYLNIQIGATTPDVLKLQDRIEHLNDA